MAILNGDKMKPPRPGKWITVWREGGKQRWQTFDSKGEAEEHESKMHLATRQKRGPAMHAPTITIADLAAKWIEVIDVRPRTREGYRTTLRMHVLPALGAMKVRDITKPFVRTFLERHRAAGASRGTARHTLAVLRSILERAVEDQILQVNPASGGFKSLKLERKTGQVQEAVEAKAFDAEQLARFLAGAQQASRPYDRRMFPALLFGAKTGARVSEIIGVRWQDLDLDKRHDVTFRQGISRGRVGPLKSGHGRIVNLSPELVSALRALKVERQRECLAAGVTVPDVVFTTPSLTRLGEQNFTRAFKRILRDAKLPGHFSPHSLRHSFASLLLQKGAPLEDVSRLLGHADVGLTSKTYGRWLRPDTAGVVALLDEIAPTGLTFRRVRPVSKKARLLAARAADN